MPQLIKPQSTKVVTKDGECHVSISLELTINVKSDGKTVSIVGSEVEEAKPNWTIQDFSPRKKVKFGKTIEE